ncbi:MAG: Outer rane autotransporter barrel [Labilithrix sp.]|nr:Outer rane autotransporter barrel [Labilithrix sp.]
MRTRLSIASTPVLASLAGLALLIGACAGSTDEAPPPSSPPDAGGTDAGRDPKPEPEPEPEEDAGTSTENDAGDADPDAADQPITVSGRVVDADGEPLVGAGVSVAGMPIVQTAADGTFTFSGVTVPYDVTVVSNVGTITVAHTFPGLSTPTPRIVPTSVLDVAPTKVHATVTGSIGAPVPAGQLARVCIEGLDRPVYGCAVVYEGQNTYEIDATWPSGSSVPVRMRALRLALDTRGATIDFTAEGSKDATLSAGASPTIDVTLGAAPPKGTLTATVSGPPGSTGVAALLFAKLGPWLSFPLEQGPGDATAKSFLGPLLPGASYSVITPAAIGQQQFAGWEVNLAAGASTTPKLVPPPTLTAPAEGATGVTTATKFDVDNPGNIPLTLFCLPSDASNPMFAVTTTKTSFTLPDLSAIGMPLPSGASYLCGLLSAGNPGDGPDALVAGDGPIGAYAKLQELANGGPGFATSGSLVTLDEQLRTVTFQ